MKTCYIFGAGEFDGILRKPDPDDIVIAADAGYKILGDIDIVPDFVVGDFDSLEYVPEHPDVEVFPKEKNDTDMGLAVSKGMSEGFDRFIIYAGLGGRLDHTLANIQLLQNIALSGKEGYLIGKDIMITALCREELKFSSACRGTVSVFSLNGAAHGVTLRGLKYELFSYDLSGNIPIGVSNEFIGKEALITLESGVLTVIAPKECINEIKRIGR